MSVPLPQQREAQRAGEQQEGDEQVTPSAQLQPPKPTPGAAKTSGYNQQASARTPYGSWPASSCSTA
jgi:hypothetical protein